MRQRRSTAPAIIPALIVSSISTSFRFLRLVLPVTAVFQLTVFAQRELPIEKPKERVVTETVKPKTEVRQAPTTGLLIVLLNPIVAGKVTVKSETGKTLKEVEADKEGQAEIALPRNRQYQVEASAPGYSTGATTSRALGAQTIVRVQLSAQSRVLRLVNMPTNAEVLIDKSAVQTTMVGGVATVADISPKKHTLTVHHPEYNDFAIEVDMSRVGLGETATLYVTPERAAKLSIASIPGATILVDGSFRGRVPQSGKLDVSIPLQQASEHSVTAEMTGYQTKTLHERFGPGIRSLDLALERIAEAVGASDGFDDMNLWSHPATWKVMTEGNNRRLQVSGAQVGILKNKVYRDFDAVFTFWMTENKGVTWVLRADSSGKNYYMFHLSGPKSTTQLPNRFYTYLVRDGNPESLNTPTPLVLDLSPNTSYTINVSVRGHRIEHSITSNDTGEKVVLGQFTDTSATKDTMLYGHFGFRALGNELFQVDDFTIDPAKDAAATRPR